MSDELVDAILPTAAALACAIDADDRADVAAVLEPLSRQELYALAVVLAAHVDVDAPMEVAHGTDRLLRRIARVSATAFGVLPESLYRTNGRGTQPVNEARAVALTVAWHATDMSSPAVAEHFGVDHTTVLYSAGRVGENQRLRAAAGRVRDRLGLTRPDDEEEVA